MLMMLKYNNGKIYKLIPRVENVENEIYIGSTTKEYLFQRLDGHRQDYRNWKSGVSKNYMTSFILFEKYGMGNVKIVLVENVNCNSKDELIEHEAFYIRNTKCVNKVIPNRTRQEYKRTNKEEIILKDKVYRENNRDVINEKKRKYYLENKERLCLKERERYYKKKLEQIAEPIR